MPSIDLKCGARVRYCVLVILIQMSRRSVIMVSFGVALLGIASHCRIAMLPRTVSAEQSATHAAAAKLASPSETVMKYVGSHGCAECHEEIYESWKRSSHHRTVLSADEARNAGYPLPKRNVDGSIPLIQTWDDVSFVVGGRERITYADAAGRVHADSYHHRIGDWDAFPERPFSDCGTCHLTGFQPPTGQDKLKEPFGRWAELGVGCEACHGPGGRHMQTYSADDIVVDHTSRTCGECHTAVNRVLPKDEWHATHDQVQSWHADPHVTGLQFHSHSAFCARCHSPQDGHFVEATDGAARLVFSEDKRSISCASCHNPHETLRDDETLASSPLAPPAAITNHFHHGDDQDFTTSDFHRLNDANLQCLQCHRGADRIDLDHAHAGCTDCHSAFHHNRGPESRITHDANHPHLSCRQCHVDGDHLLTALFSDAEFLAPKHIHNLRTLPQRAVDKYCFRYPRTQFSYVADADGGSTFAEKNEADEASADGVGEPSANVSGEMLAAALASKQHAEEIRKRLSLLFEELRAESGMPDLEIAQLQRSLTKSPNSLLPYLRLATAYAARGDAAAAHSVLEVAVDTCSPRIFVDLGLDRLREGMPRPSPSRRELQDCARQLLTITDRWAATTGGTRALVHLAAADFDAAASELSRTRQVPSHDPRQSLLFVAAEIGRNRANEVIPWLTSSTEDKSAAVSSRVALGLALISQNQFQPALRTLEPAVAAGDPTAHYLLGSAYLRQQKPAQAAEHFASAVVLDESIVEARMGLAHALRLAGNFDQAVAAYREVIRRHVTDVDAHFQLANIYKSASDNFAFQLYEKRESRAPLGVPAGVWEKLLLQFESRADKYRDLALAEYVAVLKLQPAHWEAHRQIAEIHRRDGKLAEALTHFQHLAEVEPDSWIHHYRQGTILMELGRDADALAPLRRAVALAPAQGDCYAALGLALLRTKQPANAIKAFEIGMIYEPFSPTMFTNLGVAFGELDNLEQAERVLERSLELATFPLPRVHVTYTNLAVVYLKQRRSALARQALQSAIHSYPDYAYAQELLARLSDSSNAGDDISVPEFVVNDSSEIFGEVTTVTFENE